MKTQLRNVIGWYGVAAILSAYCLNTFQIITSSSNIFLWLNLTGSAGIMIEAWGKRDWPPLVLNLVWLGIAAVGLIQHLT